MSKERIVCDCFRKTLGEIIETVNDKHCKTVQDIGDEIKAGTKCGGCIKMLKYIIEIENRN